MFVKNDLAVCFAVVVLSTAVYVFAEGACVNNESLTLEKECVAAVLLEQDSSDTKPSLSPVKKFLLRNFDSIHGPAIRRANMPYVKKFLDRPEYYDKLCEKDLTEFSNNLLQKHGILNKKVSVLVAEDHDPAFTYARVALVWDLVDSLLILIQREFYENYSADIIKAAVSHELGHVVHNDNVMRYRVPQETQTLFMLAGMVGCGVAGMFGLKKVRPEKSWGHCALGGMAGFFCSYIPLNLVYVVAFMQWMQSQEFAADAFAVKICGGDVVLGMIQALADLCPDAEGRVARFYSRLLEAHPSNDRRIAAVNKLLT